MADTVAFAMIQASGWCNGPAGKTGIGLNLWHNDQYGASQINLMIGNPMGQYVMCPGGNSPLAIESWDGTTLVCAAPVIWRQHDHAIARLTVTAQGLSVRVEGDAGAVLGAFAGPVSGQYWYERFRVE